MRLQYQSFPDAKGDSDSLAKLIALRLPTLAFKSFLDVGCNEGFFCGYALHGCATRVVGLDMSPLFIERARARFPQAEFLCQSWDELPVEHFDVILLASSVHYASDQAALIRRLIDLLRPGGTLVLELGIHPSHEKVWVEVDRGQDRRSYPSFTMLAELLEPYVWKWVDNSITQPGDPVPRKVFHVSKAKPLAFLLLQSPGFGKTSIANRIMVPSGVPVISGDDVVSRITNGSLAAPAQLQNLLDKEFDPTRLDVLYQKLFDNKLGEQLLEVIEGIAGSATFALDMYIPENYHAVAQLHFLQAGYLVTELSVSGVNVLESADSRKEMAEGYLYWLRDPAVPLAGSMVLPANAAPLNFEGILGLIESLWIDGTMLRAKGWAIHHSRLMPEYLELRIDGQRLLQQHMDRLSRPDLCAHYQCLHDMLGFLITVPASQDLLIGHMGKRVQVFAATSADGPFTQLWSFPAGNLPLASS